MAQSKMAINNRYDNEGFVRYDLDVEVTPNFTLACDTNHAAIRLEKITGGPYSSRRAIHLELQEFLSLWMVLKTARDYIHEKLRQLADGYWHRTIMGARAEEEEEEDDCQRMKKRKVDQAVPPPPTNNYRGGRLGRKVYRQDNTLESKCYRISPSHALFLSVYRSERLDQTGEREILTSASVRGYFLNSEGRPQPLVNPSFPLRADEFDYLILKGGAFIEKLEGEAKNHLHKRGNYHACNLCSALANSATKISAVELGEDWELDRTYDTLVRLVSAKLYQFVHDDDAVNLQLFLVGNYGRKLRQTTRTVEEERAFDEGVNRRIREHEAKMQRERESRGNALKEAALETIMNKGASTSAAATAIRPSTLAIPSGQPEKNVSLPLKKRKIGLVLPTASSPPSKKKNKKAKRPAERPWLSWKPSDIPGKFCDSTTDSDADSDLDPESYEAQLNRANRREWRMEQEAERERIEKEKKKNAKVEKKRKELENAMAAAAAAAETAPLSPPPPLPRNLYSPISPAESFNHLSDAAIDAAMKVAEKKEKDAAAAAAGNPNEEKALDLSSQRADEPGAGSSPRSTTTELGIAFVKEEKEEEEKEVFIESAGIWKKVATSPPPPPPPSSPPLTPVVKRELEEGEIVDVDGEEEDDDDADDGGDRTPPNAAGGRGEDGFFYTENGRRIVSRRRQERQERRRRQRQQEEPYPTQPMDPVEYARQEAAWASYLGTEPTIPPPPPSCPPPNPSPDICKRLARLSTP